VVLETQIVELTDSAARDVGIDFTNAGGSSGTATVEIKSNGTPTGTVNLQAAVYAHIAKSEGRTIARPRIVAQNGSSAQILTGDALSILTSIAVSGVNAVSQQVQYVNLGVSLQIQPRISSELRHLARLLRGIERHWLPARGIRLLANVRRRRQRRSKTVSRSSLADCCKTTSCVRSRRCR